MVLLLCVYYWLIYTEGEIIKHDFMNKTFRFQKYKNNKEQDFRVAQNLKSAM